MESKRAMNLCIVDDVAFEACIFEVKKRVPSPCRDTSDTSLFRLSANFPVI